MQTTVMVIEDDYVHYYDLELEEISVASLLEALTEDLDAEVRLISSQFKMEDGIATFEITAEINDGGSFSIETVKGHAAEGQVEFEFYPLN